MGVWTKKSKISTACMNSDKKIRKKKLFLFSFKKRKKKITIIIFHKNWKQRKAVLNEFRNLTKISKN